jgi:hypothetical protein
MSKINPTPYMAKLRERIATIGEISIMPRGGMNDRNG